MTASVAVRARVEALERSAAADIADGRDVQIDFLRGVAMFFVVVDHLALPSLLRLVTVERIGVVTGAEGFVLFSGVVLGIVNRRRLETFGWRATVRRCSRRALTLYVAAVATVSIVYAAARIPGIDGRVLTTYVDPHTHVATSLYGGRRGFSFISRVLTLRDGPGDFNILGLYVVLVLMAPLVFWLLARRLWLLVLAASWLCFAVFRFHQFTVLPSQSEHSFPILAWQVIFIGGVVVGYHFDGVRRFMSGRPGRFVFGAASLVAVVCVFYTWNNPWAYVPNDARLSLIPTHDFNLVYSHLFDRRTLGLGRLADLAAVVLVAYGLLLRHRDRVARLAGWFFVPLGRASLYVFIVHLSFVLAVAQLLWLYQNGPLHELIATGVDALALFAIWAMVRTRFLFRVIPR